MLEGHALETVERRLGQIEHLLNEVLERHSRASVKDRLSIERAIEKVGLELTGHRNTSEGAGFYSSERITESELESRLFERGQQGWGLVGLSPITTTSGSAENLFVAVFRQSVYYEAKANDSAVDSSK